MREALQAEACAQLCVAEFGETGMAWASGFPRPMLARPSQNPSQKLRNPLHTPMKGWISRSRPAARIPPRPDTRQTQAWSPCTL